MKLIMAVIFSVLIPLTAVAEEIIKNSDLLTIERCIEIALQKHPNITASANTINIYRSKIGEAKADYYPQ
ncbi:MAG: hypothetical protein AB1499_17620, partial [Nitrospirota bacterium]